MKTATKILMWLLSQIFQSIAIYLISKIPNINIKMETVVLLIIIFFVAVTIFWILFWYIKFLNKSIKSLLVKQKHYDIMLTKFRDDKPNHIYNVFEADLRLFSKKEMKVLQKYFDELELLKIVMKGTNKTFGSFMS